MVFPMEVQSGSVILEIYDALTEVIYAGLLTAVR